MGLQSLHAAAAALATLVSACAAAGRGAQLLQPGAVTGEPAPAGQPFFDDYEDNVMGGAPTVDSIVSVWAGKLLAVTGCVRFHHCKTVTVQAVPTRVLEPNELDLRHANVSWNPSDEC